MRTRRMVATVSAVALLAAGCSTSAQSNAQSHVTEADVASCHSFGHLDHESLPTESQTYKTFELLTKASNLTLRREADSAESASLVGNTSALNKDLQSITETCHYLGLIDSRGNPT
jgi:hypothetical protein